MNEYAATLSDPRWQKKRLEIFQRDGFRCLECKATKKTLHVHHRSYKQNTQPWDYPDSNFQTLCWECHERKSPKKFPRKPKTQDWRARARTSFGDYPHKADWPF